MSAWWFAPPLLLLMGALVVALQLRSLAQRGTHLQATAAKLDALKSRLREVRTAAAGLAAELQEGPRQ